MERNIPLYSYDGELVQVIDEKRLDRLVAMGRIKRVVRKRKGNVARAVLCRMPGEPKPSKLSDYRGTKYSFRQYLDDGHRCYRLRSLGEPGDEYDLAPEEVRPIFLQVVLDCVTTPAA